MFDYNLSTVESLLVLLVAAIAFFLIGRFLTQRSFSGLQKELETANTELKGSENKLRASEKSLRNLSNEKEKLQTQNVEFKEQLDLLNAQNQELRDRANTSQTDLSKESKEAEMLKRQLDDLKNKLSKANEKNRAQHKTDADWKSEIDQLKRETKRHQSDLSSSKSHVIKLKQKLQQIGLDTEELENLRLEVKGNKKEIKRLTKDCSYWEKQHYDTHHKLAAKLKEEETMHQQIESVKLEKQGLEIKEENMLKTLADYKQQLIYANERYHNLRGTTV